LAGQFVENDFGAGNFLPHDVVWLLGEIEMIPGMNTNFVAMFGNRRGAIAILLRPISSDEEGAVNARFFESGD
jgi:hypothetical protein